MYRASTDPQFHPDQTREEQMTILTHLEYPDPVHGLRPDGPLTTLHNAVMAGDETIPGRTLNESRAMLLATMTRKRNNVDVQFADIQRGWILAVSAVLVGLLGLVGIFIAIT